MLYRHAGIAPAGVPVRLSAAGGPRPTLAQAFRAKNGDLAFWVAVAHLKSKSCRNAPAAEMSDDIALGCFDRQRTLSAEAIAGALKRLTNQHRITPVLITGDLNSYAQETPLARLRKAGFVSLVHRDHPCQADRCTHYTYRYQGRTGSLDYALGNRAMLPWVFQARTWNINADEPRALDYRHRPDLQGPWRASDHNPVLTDLKLRLGR